ncbi:MAG: SMC family ATPase [Peptococcaceae bacterium]|nr:SMC family ATPase [Peptococcaceae bacterium]
MYGEASGSTRTVDTLRSDFSDPGTKTYVELIFSHKAKVYSLTRNPRYERPKKSGEGVTTENADAVLKLPDGDIITGFRDVAGKIIELLGINYKQFKQIGMIAQGEFLQLLLADSKERGEIFRRVFGTELYQTAQRLLKDLERDAKRRCDDTEKSIIQYLNGISCSEDEGGQQLSIKLENATIYSTEEIYSQLQASIIADNAYLDKQKQQLETLDRTLAGEIAKLTQAQAINQLFSSLEAAQEKKNILSEGLAEHKRQKEILQGAEQALYKVFPLEKDFLREQKAEQDLLQGIADLERQIEISTEKLKAVQETYQLEKEKAPEREIITSAIDRIAKMLPQYDLAEEVKEALNQLSAMQAKVLAELEVLQQQKTTLIFSKKKISEELEQLDDLELKMADCEQESNRIFSLQTELENLKSSHDKLMAMEDERDRLQSSFSKAEASFNSDNSVYTEKEQAFFRGQAGLMARELQDGKPCPVCGSAVHPCKAQSSVDAPSEAELHKLKHKAELSRQELQQLSENIAVRLAEIRQMKEQLDNLSSSHFPKVEKDILLIQLPELIKEALVDCLQNKERNHAQSSELKGQAKKKAQGKEQLISLERDIVDNEALIISQIQVKDNMLSDIASKTGELKSLQVSLDYEDRHKALTAIEKGKLELVELKEALQQAESAFHILQTKVNSDLALLSDQKTRYLQAEELKNQAHLVYLEKLAECGFGDEDSYHKAIKLQSEIDALKISLQEYQDSVKAVEQDFQRLLRETAGKEKQDIAELEARKQQLDREKLELDEVIRRHLLRLGTNEPIEKALGKAWIDFSSLQREYLLLNNLSKTANGELVGKQKLAFEQYVQAAYFLRVLTEANKRLRVMTNSRYELLHRADGADIRSQTGLEIDVLDHYTGRVRSVKSLSGGESFKASLSLALGLSDVIQSHAGGVEIDTLFIDEGFGALDSESLEQAIQTLAGLTAGNRLVGIISHVGELRERIDRQVIIRKTHQGSSVSSKIT